jgi:transcription antitermination factor NusG
MKTPMFREGDPVRVTSGVYTGAEGIVEDLQPECSAVRVHTKAGNVYAYLEAVAKIVKPMPTRKPNALTKR